MVRLTREQVRSIDRRAVAEYGIPSIVLMENAARSFIELIDDLLPPRGEIAIVCGGGNNGGDGLAIARHLHNRGHDVSIILAVLAEVLRGDALANWVIVERMKLKILSWTPRENESTMLALRRSPLVIDALFGTGLSRPISSDLVPLIEACNDRSVDRVVVAADVPSGLDCDTGAPLGACMIADRTITFAAEKIGFANPLAWPYVGEVIVGDIGCPRQLIESAASGERIKPWASSRLNSDYS